MSFSLTRKTDYALIALTQLGREWMSDRGPMSARTLGESYDLPLSLLMNTLKELHRAGLVDSRRGSNGGYTLTCDPREITLLHVIEALEGRVHLALCTEESEDDLCQIADQCPISDPIQRFNGLLSGFLSRMTLSDLIQPAHAQEANGVPV